MWKSPGGEPQIQDYLRLFLDAVNQGKLTLDTLVRITSYNPARLFGVYPRKGVIQPGADADLVIIDMNKEEVISNETTYTKVGWTPYHGRKVKGAPIRTILRGKTVMEDGKVVGEPGGGEFVKPVNT
jgi:dihydroorotase/allantoinase